MLNAILNPQSNKGATMAEIKTQKRKRKKRVPKNETRSDRWRRLVGERSNKFVHHVKLLKNLRSSAYDPDPEMEQELFAKFEAELMALKAVWRLTPQEEDEEEESEEEITADTQEEEEPSQETVAISEDSESDW